MSTAIATDTATFLRTTSPEYGKFLGRILRKDEDWIAYADLSTEWKVAFYRQVKGNAGDPNCEVRIYTDFEIKLPRGKELGEGQSFSDSATVYVLTPRRISLSYSDVRVLAQFMRAGATITIEASRGSSHSSTLGLAFYTLQASMPGITYGSVAIGSLTVARAQERLITGTVEV